MKVEAGKSSVELKINICGLDLAWYTNYNMCGFLQSLSEVTVIDRQKYIKELTKLLSGMAPADREAVLRGLSACFDERGDDDAVIRELGSPTFAAVQVLRGYTAPDPEEHPEAYAVEPAPAEPAAAPEPVRGLEAAPEAAVEAEAGTESGTGAGPDDVQEAETVPEEPPLEPEGRPDVPEAAEPAAVELPDVPAGPAEASGEGAEEPRTAPEPPEAVEGPAAEEPAAVEPAASGEPEVPEDFPDIEAILEEAAAEAAEEPEAREEEPEELPPEGLGVPVHGPPRPRARPALLVLYGIAAVIIGLPVTALITAAALAVLGAAGGVLFAGGLAISFCFLGLTVVADILMCAGAGLILVGVGLPLAYFAVWIFVRGAIGFVNLVIKKGGDWCYDHGEVTGK